MYQHFYVNNGLRNNLCVVLDVSQEVNHFQMHLLQSNQYPFILPLEIGEYNGQMSLNYGLDYAFSLKQYIQVMGKLTKKEFVQLMLQICDVMINKREAIQMDYFLLTEDFVFIKRDGFQVQLVVLPAKSFNGYFKRNMASFLSVVIREFVNVMECKPLYQELMIAINQPDFNITQLIEIIRRHDDSSLYQPVIKRPKALGSIINASVTQIPCPKCHFLNHQDSKFCSQCGALIEAFENTQSQDINRLKKANHKYLVLLIFGQIAALILVLILTLAALDQLILIGIGVLIIGILDVLYTFDVVNRINLTNDKLLQINNKIGSKHASTIISELDNPQLNNSTRLISSRTQESIIVKNMSGQYFLIGRSDVADLVIKDGTISNEHAELYNDGEDYYLMDLGSLNGTSVNGNRIEKSKRIKLQNGSIIKFADLEYSFTNR